MKVINGFTIFIIVWTLVLAVLTYANVMNGTFSEKQNLEKRVKTLETQLNIVVLTQEQQTKSMDKMVEALILHQR